MYSTERIMHICYKGKYVSNLTLLHALLYKSYEGICTSSSSLLPPLTRDDTAVNEPVPSMVQRYSRPHIN